MGQVRYNVWACVLAWGLLGLGASAVGAEPAQSATPGAGDGLFYYPDRKDYGTPAAYDLTFEEITLQSKDGTKLNAWFVPAKGTPQGTVLFFHGNAQNMSAHFAFVAWLPAKGYNVFAFDYRGYGKSEGAAEREGIYEDSLAALRYVKTRQDIAQDKLFVLGQSLGGAIAIPAVATGEFDGIRGVVVESSFYSYTSVAEDKAPAAVVAMLVSDAHSPGPLAAKLAPIPLLVIHGTADKVVAYKHGERLFAEAGEPKEFWKVQGGGHIPAFVGKRAATYRPKLNAFFKKCVEGKQR